MNEEIEKKLDAMGASVTDYTPEDVSTTDDFFVYGGTGVGKTSLVKTLKSHAVENDKKVLLLNNDLGEQSIQSAIHDTDPYQWLQVHELSHFNEIRDWYLYLKHRDHDFGWAALDDVTRMAQMMVDDILEDEFGDDTWGIYGALNKRFRRLLRSWRELQVNTLFLAREDTSTDPATAGFPGKALGTGDDATSVLHEFTFAFRAFTRGEGDEREYLLQTDNTEHVEAKQRVDPDFGDRLDLYEPADISAIKRKVSGQHDDA